VKKQSERDIWFLFNQIREQKSLPTHNQSVFFLGGLAQLARAPALHAGGQRFDSVILHNISSLTYWN